MCCVLYSIFFEFYLRFFFFSFSLLFFYVWMRVFIFLLSKTGVKKNGIPNTSSHVRGEQGNGGDDVWSGMFGSGPGPMSKDHSGVYWGGGRLFQMFVVFFCW